MIRLRLLLALLCLSLYSVGLMSQKSYFAQYQIPDLMLSSGLTGSSDGKLRVQTTATLQEKNRLNSDEFRGGQISVDGNIRLTQRTELGLGAFVSHDDNGLSFHSNTYSLASAAIHQYLGGRGDGHHLLSLGLSGGMAHRYPSAAHVYGFYCGTGLEDRQGGGFTGLSDRIVSLRLSIGGVWKYQSSTRFRTELGVSAINVNRPDVPFPSGDGTYLREDRLVLVFGLLEFSLGQSLSLIPSFRYTRVDQDQFQMGLSPRYYFGEGYRFVQLGLLVKRGVELGPTHGQSPKTTWIGAANLQVDYDWISVAYYGGYNNNYFSVDRVVRYSHELSITYRLGEKRIAGSNL